MKISIAIATMLAAAVLTGCQSSGPRGGGMSKDDGFKIAVPMWPTKVKQGEVRNFTISLKRGKYFKQDVKLQMKTSTGLSVDPTDTMVKASDLPTVQLRITADNDAALGDYRVVVSGTPKAGEPTSSEFIVKVIAP